MWPYILAGIGAGALKSELSDRPREQRQRRLAAETIRYSPWTGMSPRPYEEADLLGSVLEGGTTGLGMGMNFEDYAGRKALRDAQTKWYEGGSNPYRSTSGPVKQYSLGGPGYSFETEDPATSSWSEYKKRYYLR